jgi:asparagine synthase (glutamine-hydrolysing)
MTKAVKKKNTVVLSGEGADELFFGYDRIYSWANKNIWSLEEFDKYYSYGSESDNEIIFDAIRPFMIYDDAIDIVSHFFQIAHLHGLLRRLDNSTMLCSVEARVPFVDHRIIDRMAGVPFSYKMKNGIVKEPLKRIFSDVLPKEIIERKKIGFPVPLDKIFNSQNNHMDEWLKFNLEILGIN